MHKHKKQTAKLTAIVALAFAIVPSASVQAQQVSERAPFEFDTLGSRAALSRAISIEQAKDGFGNKQTVNNTSTTNNSSSVGTLTEIEAILDGSNSDLTVTSSPTQTNNGTQTSDSDQNATNSTVNE